ncbi:MAG: hypothetical protein SFX72_00970 [Isosphaeraceae bacterium]|nr:hypothetical protein [Isosphaeraceae bacterium]
MKHHLRRRIRFVAVVVASLMSAALASGGESGLGTDYLEPEESLVWRTRVRPEAVREWFPIGFHFGAARPRTFSIEQTVAQPFQKLWGLPRITADPRAGWMTDGPIRWSDPPVDPFNARDDAQFGVAASVEASGLELTAPVFVLPSATKQAQLTTQPAQMIDRLRFRAEIERLSLVRFSITNLDPERIVTLHNLRFRLGAREIALDAPILLDQTVPLMHWFCDEKQKLAPPVVRPKPGFVLFRDRFPEMDHPFVLASGRDSQQFVIGELEVEDWIHVEGFATRTDRAGRPILDRLGRPELPSEFRYSYRLARRRRLQLDLAGHIEPTTELMRSESSRPWGLAGPLAPTDRFGPLALGGSGLGGSLGSGGVGAGGPSGSAPIGGFPTFENTSTGTDPLQPGSIVPELTPGGPDPFGPESPGDGGPTAPDPGPGTGGPTDPVFPVANVPEPATWLGAVLAIALAAARGRRAFSAM